MHKFSIYVEMTHETEFATADFVILKVVKKMKSKLFFFKKNEKLFFALAKC